MAEVETISFRAGGKWTAGDLAAFTEANQNLYQAFSTAHYLSEQIARWQKSLRRLEPDFDEFAYFFLWRFYRHGLPLPPAVGFRVGEVPYMQYLLDNFDVIMADTPLTIRRIQMGSSGAISLEGLGEPIREIREFIKDLWYRNKQERELGRLEIASKRLQVAKQYRELFEESADVNPLVVVVLQAADQLESLERQEKLVDIPEHLEDELETQG